MQLKEIKMNCPIEIWGERIIYNECDLTKDFIYSETSEEYLILEENNQVYVVANKLEYQSVLNYLSINGFSLYYYYCPDIEEYRFIFETADQEVAIKFAMYEQDGTKHLQDGLVKVSGKRIGLFNFLIDHPNYVETIRIIKDKFFNWIQYSNENRLSYLLNSDHWLIFEQLDAELKHLSKWGKKNAVHD
jgi:hypothetical protein